MIIRSCIITFEIPCHDLILRNLSFIVGMLEICEYITARVSRLGWDERTPL
jgi:hypothetical protein